MFTFFKIKISNPTHLCIHAVITEIVFIYPSFTFLRTGRRVHTIDIRQLGTRWIWKFRINRRNFIVRFILQFFMIAPVIRYETYHSLGKIVH